MIKKIIDFSDEVFYYNTFLYTIYNILEFTNFFVFLFQNAGVHVFSFFLLLLGSAILLENTTTGSSVVSSIRESMMHLMMQPQSDSSTYTLNMIQESVSYYCKLIINSKLSFMLQYKL